MKKTSFLPEIILDSSSLLEELLKPYAEANNIPIIPLGEIKNRLPLYRQEWTENGKKFLEALTKLLQITFLEKTISVWVSGSVVGGRSIPLIVSANKDPKNVFGLVAHELIHRVAYRNAENWSYEAMLEKIVSSEDRLFFNHVFVFAVHRYLLEKIFDDAKGVEAEQKRTIKHDSYSKAWKFVDECGYEKLLRELGCIN